MTDEAFDSNKIEALGWRQGTVLTGDVERAARNAAPAHITFQDNDWLILSSHDCDIANSSLEKEPVVEVIRARVLSITAPNKQQTWGRNPRAIQIEAVDNGKTIILSCNVHERWAFSRELILLGAPSKERVIDDKVRRVIAEWLAKRYIRAAFPTQFDLRWRGDKSKNLKTWTDLLASFNQWIQGVYLRLNTNTELIDLQKSYRCHLLVAIPEVKKKERDWPRKREELEQQISAFWKQFSPGIFCDGVEVLGTDEITLADIEFYQRFDADWLSFSDGDDFPKTPLIADLTS